MSIYYVFDVLNSKIYICNTFQVTVSLHGGSKATVTVTTVTFDPFYSGFNASKASNVYIFEFSIPRLL